MVNFDATLFNILLSVLPEKVINYFDIQFFDKEATEYIANTTRVLIKQRNEKKESYNDFLDMLLTSIREKQLDVPDDEIIGRESLQKCRIIRIKKILKIKTVLTTFKFAGNAILFFFAGKLEPDYL